MIKQTNQQMSIELDNYLTNLINQSRHEQNNPITPLIYNDNELQNKEGILRIIERGRLHSTSMV